MPGLQGEHVVGSPVKKSKLSLRFFHKKETKRALDFSEPQPEEPKTSEAEEPGTSCDQVVSGPSPRPASPGLILSGERRENPVPFVGLSNLGNTCYLNSIIQVLYYCPGFKEGIKKLYDLSKTTDEPKEESDEQEGGASESPPASIELLRSFRTLITSVEQLQSSFLLNPESLSEGELAATPRILLHTLRQLNPMYEGFFQHDAQEVLQCILGYVHEACETIKKDKEESESGTDKDTDATGEPKPASEEDGQVSGKRKSDTEVGNAKKKPKSVKVRKSDPAEQNLGANGPMTRSKRKSSVEITTEAKEEEEEEEQEESAKANREEAPSEEEKAGKEAEEGKRKKRSRLSWLRPSGKQPSIFSKFCSVGKISSSVKSLNKKTEAEKASEESAREPSPQKVQPEVREKEAVKPQGVLGLMEDLFQGRLVLRTRCLECESFTERREDFHDISVPVLDEQPGSPDDLSEVSPDPKPELKTLKWAIGQFASVERIVGEDKYFCETCRHYTEAERSLLFDKTPEVITIHLKRFSANGLELDPYAGLSKVNTPLQTPLTLSLEEWCTRSMSSRGQQYQLFAVVMHSGVTISSGHYTAYIRMCDLNDVKLWPRERKEAKEERRQQEEESKGGGAQAKDDVPDYDDGEVSIRGSSRAPRRASLSGGKKLSEGGVGLLGGQRSASGCELGGKAAKTAEKAAAQGSKRRKTAADGGQTSSSTTGVKEEEQPAAVAAAASSCRGEEASAQQALSSLQEYEGKWLLFDDSEVRLFEEDDFLRACSPETSSSLTPYLLFYRRKPEPPR